MTTKADDAVREPANDTQLTRSVSCPNCNAMSVFAKSNPYRPFCSERCKSMDFGAWADESFKMPDPNDSPDGTAYEIQLQ